MADTPQRAGRAGTYLTSPYEINVSYGDRTAGIVRGTGADWFGPLNPLWPIAPPDIAGRQWDFPSGYNLQTVRRPYEPITFETLRQFAQNCDILRLVIETRKDQFARQQWTIAPREDNPKTQDADIKMLTALFNRPDGIHTFSDWARMLLEDLFVIDAATLYCQRNRGGKLIALMPLDGATIKPVIDDWGRKPLPYRDDGGTLITPVAYQQILKGYPAVDYSARDLIYRPRNVRTTTPYGFSPVEQVFTTVNISLRHQLFQLAYYTEGNIPEALVGVPPTWTPDQIASFQRYFDDLYSGNVENRRHAKFVPGEIAKGFVQTKDVTLSGPFDEWLAKIISFAFSIPPNWFTKQMANRSGAETSKEAAEEEGLSPILEWAKQLIDDILEFDFNLPGLEFVWRHEEAIDEQIQSTILIGYVGAGIQTRNEARDALGFDAIDDPAADKLMVTTGAGLMPLDANTIDGKQANIDAFGAPDGSMMPETAPKNGQENVISGVKAHENQGTSGRPERNGNEAKKFVKRDVSDEARDSSGRWTSGGSGGTDGESESDKRERQKAKARERAAASRARAKQWAKEAERGKTRVSTSQSIHAQTAEEERAHYHAVIRKIVQGTALTAGAALVAALAPEAGLPFVAAKLTLAAETIGGVMLADAAVTTGRHILYKIGVDSEYAESIIAAIAEHILKKSAGAAADIQAVMALKSEWPAVADMAVEMALDYVAEHAPDAPLAAHNAIADALEAEAAKFKAKIAAMTADDLGEAQKIAKGYDPSEARDKAGRWTTEATDEELAAMDATTGFTEEEKTKYQLPSEDYVAAQESLQEHEEAITSMNSAIRRHVDALRSIRREYDKHVAGAIDNTIDMNNIRGDAGLKEIPSKIAYNADALNDTIKEFTDEAAKEKYYKLLKAGGRAASPVPFERAAFRKAREAVAAIMTAVLAKISKKAAAHVGTRLKALGKAEESPEDIADGADFTDFEEVVPDIGDALADIATDSMRQTLVQIGVSDRADLMNQVNEGAVDAAHARAAEMVGMRRLPDGSLAPSKNAKNTITDTTRDAIRKIIADGLADNIGSDAISKNIEDATAFSPERAQLIAHTEVGNINSAASLDSAQAAADAGVEVLKGWLTAGDDKVEDICRANAAAGFIDLDDDFPSGDAAPLAHPRCRCTVHYRVAETEDAGKLLKALASKTDANYRAGNAAQHCSICTMFRAPHSCTAVEGKIEPDDLCDFFKARTDNFKWTK